MLATFKRQMGGYFSRPLSKKVELESFLDGDR